MAKYVKTEEGYKKYQEVEAINSNKMDNVNPTGTGSFSLNRKSGTIVGISSFAEGSRTTASGKYSHAEGNSTTASNIGSHAEGYSTTASGTYSHAEGESTTASSSSSHSEGRNTTASNIGSHAEGYSTTASGAVSHAEGYSTNKFSSVVTATNPTNDAIITAWKNKKFSLASGSGSHVEGKDNLALADYSHAEGYSTTASGDYSHAEGFGTTASGSSSHAEGAGTKASSENQHVQGKFNIEDSSGTYADIIGNGTSSSKRSNAATVDWSGNAWYAGDVYVGSTSGTNKDSGSKKLATEEYVNSAVSGIPSGGGDIPEALPNPYALTFTGAVTGSYDGSQAVTVEIPSGVTDDHINSLIDTKLGVIENGSY